MKKLLGEFSLPAVKTKENSSHQAVAPRQPLERANTEDGMTKITFLAPRRERRLYCNYGSWLDDVCTSRHTPGFQKHFITLINTAY